MTTAERLQSIIDSKSAIATAITEKGGTLASAAPLADYAAAVRSIPTGGTEKYPLDKLGYDDDGSLATSIANTMSLWEGKTPYGGVFGDNTTIRVLPNIDLSNATNLQNYANGCSALVYVPYIDAPKVTNINYLLPKTTSLKYVPGINAPLATTASGLFNLSTVEYIGDLKLPKLSNTNGLFGNLTHLVAIGNLELASSVSNASLMFYNCTKLQFMDLSSTKFTTINEMFSMCTSLKEAHINMQNTTNAKMIFGASSANGCPNVIPWITFGSHSGCNVNGTGTKAIGTNLLKRYQESLVSIDLRGAINWGTVHPSSLQSFIDNLPARFYKDTNNMNVITAGSACTIQFSAATKATLTDAQKIQITSKNYTIA